MEVLGPDLRQLLELFISHDVDFIVVGAYALAFLGHSRFTEDIDLWIQCSEVNAARVRAALTEFGIPIGDEEARQLAEDRKILQFGVSSQRVDILTFLDGCNFDVAKRRSTPARLSKLSVPFLSLEDYVLTKRASARRKDIRDLEDLEEALGRPLPGNETRNREEPD